MSQHPYVFYSLSKHSIIVFNPKTLRAKFATESYLEQAIRKIKKRKIIFKDGSGRKEELKKIISDYWICGLLEERKKEITFSRENIGKESFHFANEIKKETTNGGEKKENGR